jgi:hypothetical protein
LFWLVELNAKDVEISHDGTRASMRASNVPLVDSFVFGGQNQIGAIASFSFRWHATGPFVKQGKGADPKPPPATDPAAFTGRFARASAEGTFSVRELGFSFTSIGTVKSDPQGYAEMGFESNGSLLVPNP